MGLELKYSINKTDVPVRKAVPTKKGGGLELKYSIKQPVAKAPVVVQPTVSTPAPIKMDPNYDPNKFSITTGVPAMAASTPAVVLPKPKPVMPPKASVITPVTPSKVAKIPYNGPTQQYSDNLKAAQAAGDKVETVPVPLNKPISPEPVLSPATKNKQYLDENKAQVEAAKTTTQKVVDIAKRVPEVYKQSWKHPITSAQDMGRGFQEGSTNITAGALNMIGDKEGADYIRKINPTPEEAKTQAGKDLQSIGKFIPELALFAGIEVATGGLATPEIVTGMTGRQVAKVAARKLLQPAVSNVAAGQVIYDGKSGKSRGETAVWDGALGSLFGLGDLALSKGALKGVKDALNNTIITKLEADKAAGKILTAEQENVVAKAVTLRKASDLEPIDTKFKDLINEAKTTDELDAIDAVHADLTAQVRQAGDEEAAQVLDQSFLKAKQAKKDELSGLLEQKAKAYDDFMNDEKSIPMLEAYQKEAVANETHNSARELYYNAMVNNAISNTPAFAKESVIKDIMGEGTIMVKTSRGQERYIIAMTQDEIKAYARNGYKTHIGVDSMAEEAGFTNGLDYLETVKSLSKKMPQMSAPEKYAHDYLMDVDGEYYDLVKKIENVKQVIKEQYGKTAEAIALRAESATKTTTKSVVKLPKGKSAAGAVTGPAIMKDGLVYGNKEKKFIKTAIKSDIPSDAAKKVLKKDTGYTPVGHEEITAAAKARVKENPSAAEAFINDTTRKLDGETTATAIELMAHYAKKGDVDAELRIINTFEEKARDAGRMIEAIKLMNKLSPAAIVKKAEQLVEQANKMKNFGKDIVLTEEMKQNFIKMSQNLTTLTGEAKTIATQELNKALSELKYVGLGKWLGTIQAMSMLLNTTTVMRNIVGNEIFWRLERFNHLIASSIDNARSIVTGTDRTIMFNWNNQSNYWQGFMAGAKGGWGGYSPRASDYIGGHAFKSKWNPLFYFERSLGASLKSFDEAAFRRAYNTTLYEQATLLAHNNGLRGGARKEAAIKLMKKMDENAISIAEEAGSRAVFENENGISNALKGVKRWLNQPFGRKSKMSRFTSADFGLGDFVVKFTQVPGAILSAGIEYSPAGIIKSLAELTPLFREGAKVNQRDFQMALTRGLVGTFGLTGLGYELASKGIITGKASPDADIRALEQKTGDGQYRLNVSALGRFISSGMEAQKFENGDTLISYDWAQPIAIPLSIGANANKKGFSATAYETTADYGKVALETLASGVDTIAEQNFFRTIKSLIDDPTKGMIDLATMAPSTFIPSMLNKVRMKTDVDPETGKTIARSTYDPSLVQQSINSVKNKIPGLAQTLPQDYDTLGDKKWATDDNSIVGIFMSPAFRSTIKKDTNAQMILDVYEQTGASGVYPRKLDKNITVDGKKIVFSANEYVQYQKYVGARTAQEFAKLSANKSFQRLDYDRKAKEMTSKLGDISNELKAYLRDKELANLKATDDKAYQELRKKINKSPSEARMVIHMRKNGLTIK